MQKKRHIWPVPGYITFVSDLRWPANDRRRVKWKKSAKRFRFEENGKSIKFLYLVQSIQVALAEVEWGREETLKKTNLNSRQNLNDFLLSLNF